MFPWGEVKATEGRKKSKEERREGIVGGGKKARGLFKLGVLLGAELLFMCGGAFYLQRAVRSFSQSLD